MFQTYVSLNIFVQLVLNDSLQVFLHCLNVGADFLNVCLTDVEGADAYHTNERSEHVFQRIFWYTQKLKRRREANILRTSPNLKCKINIIIIFNIFKPAKKISLLFSSYNASQRPSSGSIPNISTLRSAGLMTCARSTASSKVKVSPTSTREPEMVWEATSRRRTVVLSYPVPSWRIKNS